jgi:hypothetical protein
MPGTATPRDSSENSLHEQRGDTKTHRGQFTLGDFRQMEELYLLAMRNLIDLYEA